MDNHDERDDAAERIASELKELDKIANLPIALEDAFFPFGERKRDYRAFWGKAKQVSALFKECHLKREDRDRLWAKQSGLCEAVRELQERERESKSHKSQQNRDAIMAALREALLWTNGAKCLNDLSEARSRLQQTMEMMKEGFLLKDHREECWEQWREVNDLIPFKRKDICDLNYDVIGQDISRISSLAVYGDPYDALQEIKAVQQRIKASELTKDQRQLLRDALQEWWDRAIERLNERRQERQHKHAEWRERSQDKIGRLETLRDKNDNIVSRIRDQIDDLEEKIANAWNADYADRARGWVSEKYEKIADIERTNGELEEKIREIRSQLAGD